jgi:SnoaL-like domain
MTAPDNIDPKPLTVADRAAIEDLVSAYVLALDVGDVAGAMALFADEAEFRTYGRIFAGDRLQRMFERAPRGQHLAGRSLVATASEGATVRSQLMFVPADRSETRLAIYDDVVVKVEDRWLFRSRDVRFMDAEGVLRETP